MAKYDCEICRGEGQIRLPIYRRVTAAAVFDGSAAAIEESHKVYPCPECALTAPTERIAIVDVHSRITRRELFADEKFVEAAYRDIAFQIADRLLRNNFFRFVTRPADRTANYAATITGTLGAVAPTIVATIEQRQREHQEKIAAEVTNEATAQIANWGSSYGARGIDKGTAYQLIAEALKTVLAKHPKEPT